MTEYNVLSTRIETAQYAAFQAANRDDSSQQSKKRQIIAALLIGAVALGVIMLIVLSLNTPVQEIYDEEWENGHVVVSVEQGVQREREYLDEGGLPLKREVFDANGVMTSYSEYTYTYDDSGRTLRTEYRYNPDGTLISELHSAG